MKWHCRDRWDIASEHCLGKEDHNKKNIRKGKQTPSTRKVTESYTWRVKHSIFRAVVGRSAVKPAAVEILNHLFFCWFWFFPWSANASAMSVHSTGGTQTWNTIKPYIFFLPKRKWSGEKNALLAQLLTNVDTCRHSQKWWRRTHHPIIANSNPNVIVHHCKFYPIFAGKAWIYEVFGHWMNEWMPLVFGTFMSIYWDSNCSD